MVNYRDRRRGREIRAVAPDGVDRIVEVALGANLALDLAVAAPHASIVTYAADAKQPALPVRELMIRNLVLRFVLLYKVPPEALRRAGADITAALRPAAHRVAAAPVQPGRDRRRARRRRGRRGRQGSLDM